MVFVDTRVNLPNFRFVDSGIFFRRFRRVSWRGNTKVFIWLLYYLFDILHKFSYWLKTNRRKVGGVTNYVEGKRFLFLRHLRRNFFIWTYKLFDISKCVNIEVRQSCFNNLYVSWHLQNQIPDYVPLFLVFVVRFQHLDIREI